MSRIPGPAATGRLHPSPGSGSGRLARRRPRSLPARAARSGGGTDSIAPRIRAQWPSAAAVREPPVPSLDIVPSTSWSAVALDAIPEPFAGALDEIAIVIADEPSPEQRRGERDRRGRDPVRPVRGRAADRMGCRLGADPEPDHALPAAARGGLRRPRRPRRRGLDHGHPRARPPPRHRRRPAPRARHRLTVSRTGAPRTAPRPIRPPAKAMQHRDRQPAEPAPAGPDGRRVAIASRPDVVETERGPRQADEHHDLRRHRDGVAPCRSASRGRRRRP